MSKLAVDVVLLSNEVVTSKAIELNRVLSGDYMTGIRLDRDDCLPHVSLAMGALEAEELPTVEDILDELACRHKGIELAVTGVETVTDVAGLEVSSLKIEASDALQKLHEDVMRQLGPLLSHDIEEDMLHEESGVSANTLGWIMNYPQKAAWSNFTPHITIGFGRIPEIESGLKFKPLRLALCHLANHCTCARILRFSKIN